MNYDTALRGYTAKRIEEIDGADILVGIPCYNNETHPYSRYPDGYPRISKTL